MHQKFTHCYAARSLMSVLCLLLPCIYSVAQKSTQPGRNVTLTSSRIPLGDVFNVIEKQTGVLLFFGDLNTNQTVGVKFVATPVEDALGEMLPPIGLTYEYVKGNKDKIFIKSIMPSKKDTVMMTSISGVVTDEKGEPLPGASVRVKGTNVGTATKQNGSFTLNRSGEKDVLQVSFTGFMMEEVAVLGKSDVKVRLKAGDNSLNEQVVTAYGTSTRKALTSALSEVKGEQIQSLPNRSFDKSLQGLVPGLLVTNGTGLPGGGVSNFVLRGIATAASVENGATARNPLIVIDGVPVNQEPVQIYSQGLVNPIGNPLAQLNPSDIESISVLKDAAAVALYGSRASNGVILVTTKKGKSGKVVFSFRHQTDIATRLKGNLKVLNQKEYLELLFEAYRNSDSRYSDEKLIIEDLKTKFPSRSNGEFYSQSDWNKEIFTNAATTIANELSMSGGDDRNNFYLNLEYTKQNGVVKKTEYNRKSIRFNFESRPSEWIKIGFKNSMSYNVQKYPGASKNGTDVSFATLISPLNPIRLTDDEYMLNYRWGVNSFIASNPLAVREYNISQNSSYRGLGKIYTEINPIKNLYLSLNAGVDYSQVAAKEKDDPRLIDLTGTVGVGRVEELESRNTNLITTNTARYEKTLGVLHSVSLIIGQEAQILNQKRLSIAVKDLKLPYYDQINSPGVNLLRKDGFSFKETLFSYFGQLNYSFRNRYFLSGSIRRDGSSRFGSDKRYGTYWSTGMGWVVSDEMFMKKTPFNYLKLRGSVGASGNASAINASTRYDELYNLSFLGATAVQGTSVPGNPNVQWEQTYTWDLGLEGKVFKNRVSFGIDIYNRATKNLLYQINLPQSSGYYSVLSNIGQMSNKGVEIMMSTGIIQNKDFSWNFSINWSSNKNKLVKANVPTVTLSQGVLANEEGRNFNSFFVPKWGGVDNQNGNSLWVDSSGKLTSDYSHAKFGFVGKPQPDAFGAITNTFSYRNLELSLMLYYQYGFEIYDQSSPGGLLNDGSNPYVNQSRKALDRWRKPGDEAENPRRVLNNTPQTTTPSTRFLYDGDYIRLQNVRFVYNIPEFLLKRMRLSLLKAYVQGNNLAVWTKYNGNDPGDVNVVGNSQLAYPSQRSYSLGIMANF